MDSLKRIFRNAYIVCTAAVLLSVCVTAVLLATMVLGVPVRRSGSSSVDAFGAYRMFLSNAVSDAVAGTSSVKKHYWISRDAQAGPVPNPDCYTELRSEEDLAQVLDRAGELLEGQELYFSMDRPLMPGQPVRCYLDDTILAITWKEIIDYGVYTFSEIKIAHPSQFRRFLAGGDFGVDQKFTTTEMSRSVNAVVASSGDFYLFRNTGIVVYDGVVRRVHNGVVDTCYVDVNGDLYITGVWDYMDKEASQKFVDDNQILFSLAFGPALVQQGETCTTNDYRMGEVNDQYPRAALAQRDKLHYILATVNAEEHYGNMPTIHLFAKRIQQTGCPIAYALDGGQTAVLTMDGEAVNSVMYGYERKISDIIYFATAIPH